jgi:hypothetical protein
VQSAQRFIDKVGLDVTARILADPDEFADFLHLCTFKTPIFLKVFYFIS